MKQKKNILFTFDYELFLGERSGTVRECLIEPTENISHILDSYKIKGIFFVDTVYLICLRKISLKEASAAEDLDAIFLQLRNLIKQGYYLFLHLHPHWLDAVYVPEAREWRLKDLSKYRFHNLDEQQRQYLFEESIKILQEIVFPINQHYQINAYRAGGWSIEPFSDFRPFFEKSKIRYDFSVLPGLTEFSTARYFDYSNIPAGKNIYRFQDSVTEENSNGSFTEFCVSVLRFNKAIDILNRAWLKVVSKLQKSKNCGRGIGAVAKYFSDPNEDKKYEVSAIESMTAIKLLLYINFLKKNNYLHIASHPKMINPHNLKVFKKFLRLVFAKYQIETDFQKMR